MKKSILAVGVVATLALAGCSGTKADAEFSCSDAPSACAGGTHTKVITMPDGFRNVVFTCNGTTGVYVTSRGWDETGVNLPSLPSGIAVLANDPGCR